MYKNAGHGTDAMTGLKQGDSLDVLTGLGNGFDLDRSGKQPLLIAGGSGVSPIYCLAERLTGNGITPAVVMGFASSENVVMEEGGNGVFTKSKFRLEYLNFREFCRFFIKGIHRSFDTGIDYTAKIFSCFGNSLAGGCGAEIDNDERAAVFFKCRIGINKSVCAHFLRVFIKVRHIAEDHCGCHRQGSGYFRGVSHLQ